MIREADYDNFRKNDRKRYSNREIHVIWTTLGRCGVSSNNGRDACKRLISNCSARSHQVIWKRRELHVNKGARTIYHISSNCISLIYVVSRWFLQWKGKKIDVRITVDIWFWDKYKHEKCNKSYQTTNIRKSLFRNIQPSFHVLLRSPSRLTLIDKYCCDKDNNLFIYPMENSDRISINRVYS